MNISDLYPIIIEKSNEIVIEWNSNSILSGIPVGTPVELLYKKKDFNQHFKSFEKYIYSKISENEAIIIKKYGRTEFYALNDDCIMVEREKLSKAIPEVIKNNTDLERCTYYSDHFSLSYIASGEKSKFGEYILSTYPRFGLACGFNEYDGILFLFQPELKK
jgi:hypothetical protein